jgi:hypothetical protein
MMLARQWKEKDFPAQSWHSEQRQSFVNATRTYEPKAHPAKRPTSQWNKKVGADD